MNIENEIEEIKKRLDRLEENADKQDEKAFKTLGMQQFLENEKRFPSAIPYSEKFPAMATAEDIKESKYLSNFLTVNLIKDSVKVLDQYIDKYIQLTGAKPEDLILVQEFKGNSISYSLKKKEEKENG